MASMSLTLSPSRDKEQVSLFFSLLLVQKREKLLQHIYTLTMTSDTVTTSNKKEISWHVKADYTNFDIMLISRRTRCTRFHVFFVLPYGNLTTFSVIKGSVLVLYVVTDSSISSSISPLHSPRYLKIKNTIIPRNPDKRESKCQASYIHAVIKNCRYFYGSFFELLPKIDA